MRFGATAPLPSTQLHAAPPSVRKAALRRYDAYLDEGAEHCATPAAWRKAVLDSPEFATLRTDSQRTLTGVVWRLTCTADWTVHTSRLGWDSLAEQLGCSRRTVARWLAWLRDHRWLVWVEKGSTPRWRKRAVQRVLDAAARHAGVEAGDRQPVYLLTVPQPLGRDDQDLDEPTTGGEESSSSPNGYGLCGVEELVTPTPSGVVVHLPFSRASRSTPRELTDFTLRTVPRTGQGRLKAVEILRDQVVPAHPLRRVGPRRVRAMLRVFFEAGWSARDVQFALDHSPTGRPHGFSQAVRAPAGWLRARLELWTDASGAPLPSRTATAQASLAASRARAAADRARAAEDRKLRVAAADHEGFQSARAALRDAARRGLR